MMRNLIKAELLRFASSRLLLLVGVVGIITAVWFGFEMVLDVKPLTDEERVLQIEQYEQAMADFWLQYEEYCRPGMSYRDQICIDVVSYIPKLEEFPRPVISFQALVSLTLPSTGQLSLLVVVVFVAVLVGTELSSGVLTTRLTFTPRRIHVLWAKVLVSGLFGLAITAWWIGLGFATNIVGYVQLNSVAGLVAEPWLAWQMGRFLFLGFMAGCLTALVTVLLGSYGRTAVLVVGVYLFSTVAEASLFLIDFDYPSNSFASRVMILLPTVHLTSLISGKWNIVNYNSAGQQVELMSVSYVESLCYLGLWTVLLGVVVSFVFKRRDILR